MRRNIISILGMISVLWIVEFTKGVGNWKSCYRGAKFVDTTRTVVWFSIYQCRFSNIPRIFNLPVQCTTDRRVRLWDFNLPDTFSIYRWRWHCKISIYRWRWHWIYHWHCEISIYLHWHWIHRWHCKISIYRWRWKISINVIE